MPDTRVEDIYAEVKARAAGFDLRPGARLNESALAAELGVSRTPLREALNRLVAERLIDFRPGAGFFCRAFEPQEMIDLYELRQAIECRAVRLAASRANAETLAALAAETKATGLDVTGLTIAEAVARDEAFHIGIAAASGNAEIVHTLARLNDRLRFLRWVRVGARVRQTKAEHLRILDALLARDAAAAEAEMAQHIEQRQDQVVAAVREGIGSIYLGEAEALAAQILEER